MKVNDVKFEIYIPENYSQQLRMELNKKGVLTIGNYDHCVSLTHVKGYWRPKEGANPYDGVVGEISEADEVKVEFRCRECHVQKVIDVIHYVHPYEEPLFHILPVLNQDYIK